MSHPHPKYILAVLVSRIYRNRGQLGSSVAANNMFPLTVHTVCVLIIAELAMAA